MEETFRLAGPVGCALITPFLPNGEVDYDSAARLANHLVENGVDHLVLSGTTGEAPTTHQPEKSQLIRVVREAVGQKAYITAGAGSNDTRHAMRMAAAAEEAGADGLLVVTPYYSRPSQEGIYAHIKAVAEMVDLPVYLYDIPGRTGVALTDDTIMRLAEIDNVVALKDATANIERGAKRLRETGLAWYSGDDGLNYAWLTHGAVGIISVVAQVAPQLIVRQVRATLEGRYEEAFDQAMALSELVDAIMGSGQGAIMAKHALQMQGIISHSTARLPLVQASADEQKALREVLAAYELI